MPPQHTISSSWTLHTATTPRDRKKSPILSSCLVFGKSAAGLPCQSAIFSSYQSPLLQAAVCYGLIHNAHCFTFTGPGDQTDNLGGCGCLYGCSLHVRTPYILRPHYVRGALRSSSCSTSPLDRLPTANADQTLWQPSSRSQALGIPAPWALVWHFPTTQERPGILGLANEDPGLACRDLITSFGTVRSLCERLSVGCQPTSLHPVAPPLACLWRTWDGFVTRGSGLERPDWTAQHHTYMRTSPEGTSLITLLYRARFTWEKLACLGAGVVTTTSSCSYLHSAIPG